MHDAVEKVRELMGHSGVLAGRVLDFLLPPVCLNCGEVVDSPGRLCAPCWTGIAFIAPPFCACCGLPFPFDLGPEALCAACIASPPRYGRARAVLRYDDVAKAPILALKHADRLDLVPGFVPWLDRAGRGLIETSDLIVPVPLHPFRLWSRRYNQAAELARAGAVLSPTI